MASVTAQCKRLTFKAYRGDAKTLLAFNLTTRAAARNLAGFTIECRPGKGAAYYLFNELQFKTPGAHAQDPAQPAYSSINAPIHKFRWLHVPGSSHQGTTPFFGAYRYTVTPRYFDASQSLLPLDPSLSASLTVTVAPFEHRKLSVAFTRGYMQSQAFVRHFGLHALVQPAKHTLLFDTSQSAGTNAAGQHYTYADEYAWMGFTARDRIFALLDEVKKNTALRLDLFAYDLNEPDIIQRLLALASEGRVRVILDNASLHHNTSTPKPEDEFEQLFTAKATGNAAIKRGKFGRYAHDKVMVVSNARGPLKVLTGSTNFSVTGLYVNANHVLVFDDPKVATAYANVFEHAWTTGVTLAGFRSSPLASADGVSISSRATPPTDITFAPHTAAVATTVLDDVAARIARERRASKKTGSVLFAVMQVDNGTSPTWDALRDLHTDQSIFSYGITDTTSGIVLYQPKQKTGVLVTGKPGPSQLPPPFNQVPGVGIGHQIHHKFIVCGFAGPNPVVYCGSSNLALGGEQQNGDNLLAIHDRDVATVFAIEALTLVDHFDFLDRAAQTAGSTAPKTAVPALKRQAALDAGWFLSTSDTWVEPYYDAQDLRYVDRRLFA
ncbi:MAG: phospholipase D-like domain-containing protein [Acidobacteriaceae bacterium]|nr:phospholipase D-like domain-containing protein [Acidobacteriaceae bacterium]